MRSFWSYSPREGANCIGTTQEIKSEISTSYSPREGANCIKGQLNIEGAKISYSPREGANCIDYRHKVIEKIGELQSP